MPTARTPGRRTYDWPPLVRTAGVIVAAPFIATWHGAGWLISPLTGRDGRPSFSKIMCLLVLGCYVLGAALPADVAIVVIIAAHGTSLLRDLINKGSVAISAASTFGATVTGKLSDVFGRRDADSAHAAAPVVAAAVPVAVAPVVVTTPDPTPAEAAVLAARDHNGDGTEYVG